MLTNIVYQHLSHPLRHERGCGQRCATDCDVRAFEAFLERPVTDADRRADALREQRIPALLRGEIPGRQEVGHEAGQPAQ